MYKVTSHHPLILNFLMLFQKNGRWEESISLSKQDKLYKDAMITAATSNTTEVAEELLSYFVDIGNKECFAALLFICFDLLRSDIVEELSWQHGLNDFYMPYKIQVQRSLVEKVSQPSTFECIIFDIIFAISSHSWRRRSKNDPRKTPKKSRRKLRLLSSTQEALADYFSLTGRLIY